MFRRSASSQPSVSEHSKLRTRQLTEFIKLNPTAILNNNNNSNPQDSTANYSLTIPTQTVGPLILSVLLTPQFPERPPILSLKLTSQQLSNNKLQYKYLDSNGFLSLHPKIQSHTWVSK